MGGIGIYGVISVCLFFSVFAGTLLWAFQLKKPFLNAMGSLPLEEAESEVTQPSSESKSQPNEKGACRHE
jgi:hypothetical protein